LLVGALYFNSTAGVMSVWSGSSWTAINAASSYSAPTLGSTIIPTGSTVTTIEGFVKLVSEAYTSLDSNSKEVDITLMNIMGGY
jgi:hypothetical protein